MDNMMISLELGPEFQATLASMTGLGDRVALATSKGLGHAVVFGADFVVKYELMGQSLKRRSGNLAKAVQGWKESDFEGVVGVKPGSAVEKYKAQLGADDIVPTHGRLLAIPFGDSVTGAGVLKAGMPDSPRAYPGGFFQEHNGHLFFVEPARGRNKTLKLRYLFLMVPRVKGSNALANGTLIAADGMTQRIEDEISKAIA